MKFHGYETLYDYANRIGNGRYKHDGVAAFYQRDTARYKGLDGAAHKMAVLANKVEEDWIEDVKPYFKVWPSIMAALLSLKLDIPASQIAASRDPLCIRFPVGLERSAGMTSILFYSCAEKGGAIVVLPKFDISQIKEFRECDAPFIIPITPSDDEGETIEDYIATMHGDAATTAGHDGKAILREISKIILSVMLLERDPSIIKPDVLADDRRRFDESTDPEERARLVAKAKKRGIVGWRIGEEYETIPHFRRPHFALRHTGKGRTVPRIVPVKAAIVHRQKLTEVPTGYILPDGREIEP